MKRKGRKGGRYYVCPFNGYTCWAYSESEARTLLNTDRVILRTEYNRINKTITKDNVWKTNQNLSKSH